MMRVKRAVLLLIALLGPLVTIPATLSAQAGSVPVMSLVVDESRAAQRIVLVHEEITVQPGTLELAYPKWIPGEHGPTGPVEHVAALKIHAGDQPLTWTRNPEDLFSFHVDVPSGTTRIAIDFSVLLQNTISDHQLLLAWNRTVLYPRHIDKQQLLIEPSLVLPAGWKQASSLRVVSEMNGRITYAPTSLERLIDSPVLAAEFLRSAPLTASWPAVLHVAGDSQSAIDKADEAQAFRIFGSLIDQDRAMFGFRHWQTMHLLVAQSGVGYTDGLEHADSPFHAIGDAGLAKVDELAKFGVPLLAHEQSHSWVGKYRRAAEMYSKPDFQGPERTSLLWVYEGLNQYVGLLLATRAGFNDAAYARDLLAGWAAAMANSPGRASTPLVDTATQNWILRTVDYGWRSLRRSQDYYVEGALIWLEADAIIRERSAGQRSLDDFLRVFFGQRDSDPIVVTYTREDVEAGLAAVQPYDWHAFIESRVYAVNAPPPTRGFDASGWRLIYNAVPNADKFIPPFGSPPGVQVFSIGVLVRNDGTIDDVVAGSPAYEAGLGPHMTIVSVDGRSFSIDQLVESIAHPSNGRISIGVKNFDSIRTYDIRYAGGLRYPHLEQIPGRMDYLSEILRAKPMEARR